MDQLVVTTRGTKQGRLYLDHWITSSFQDSRQHTADFQAPYINPTTQSHWLILLRAWNTPLQMPLDAAVSTLQQQGIDTIRQRLVRRLMQGAKPAPLATLRNRYAAYDITQNADGTLRGKPIYFVRYGETYINLGDDYRARSRTYRTQGQLLEQCNKLLFDLAVAHRSSHDEAARAELAAMYLTLTRHLLDQGFAAGSAQGTLHHLGYSMRDFYTAPVLMQEVLRDARLDTSVQQAMEWFSGVGEVKPAPTHPGIDIDAFNTSLIGRLSSILMMRDTPKKVAYLRSFARWADNGYRYAPGTAPCFKSDGTVFHHRHHYPAYAIGGFDGGVQAIWLLHATPYAISRESHENQKRALLEMRFYCNRRSFPLALSGRHPDGKGALIPWQYALLADAGTADGSQATDAELAAAYMRLVTPKDPTYKRFAAQGIRPETSPEGCRVYGYNASLAQRRGDWLLTAAGHSRYLWSAEIYVGANHYGRYLTHGSLQLLADGDPVDSFGSGFRQEGWDWRRIPGTTAAVIPMPDLKATIRNVDTCSGYEEMLLSNETFAGGVSHGGRHGVWGMKLHENDKYNGSLRARKSYFFFDNRVVALGSGIENALPGARVATTLFQCHLHDPAAPISVDGDSIRTFPYTATLPGAALRDNLGTAYFIPRGEVHITRSTQQSLHEETDAPTTGNFATAWIDHGEIVRNGEYEYLMVVKPTDKELTDYTSALPYRVLAHTDRAHIVRDVQTGVTGYVLYEAGEVGDALLATTSHPLLAMIGGDKQQITLSLCDPDLRFYTGVPDEIRGADGKTVERSIYSRSWIDTPSQPSRVQVALHGAWMLAEEAAHCTVTQTGATTTIDIVCREGATRELKLSNVL